MANSIKEAMKEAGVNILSFKQEEIFSDKLDNTKVYLPNNIAWARRYMVDDAYTDSLKDDDTFEMDCIIAKDNESINLTKLFNNPKELGYYEKIANNGFIDTVVESTDKTWGIKFSGYNMYANIDKFVSCNFVEDIVRLDNNNCRVTINKKKFRDYYNTVIINFAKWCVSHHISSDKCTYLVENPESIMEA